MRFHLAAITLLAATVTSPLALAQTTAPAPSASPSATTATRSTPATATSGQWRASKLVGLNVYNEQNEKLGDISEVLIDTSGKVTGVVIGVGGFLGMGQRDIMIGLDKLRFVNEPVRTNVATNTTSSTPTTTGSTRTTTDSTATTTTTTSTAAERRWYPDHAVLAGATKDSVKNMTEFKYN